MTTMGATFSVTLENALGFADTPKVSATYKRYFLEAAGTSTTGLFKPKYKVLPPDSLGFSESTLSKSDANRIISDSLGLSDVITVSLPAVTATRLIVDAIGFSDNVLRKADALRSITESLALPNQTPSRRTVVLFPNVVTQEVELGAITWSNINNVKADDGNYATVANSPSDNYSQTLVLSDFQANIGLTEKITGIQLLVKGHCDTPPLAGYISSTEFHRADATESNNTPSTSLTTTPTIYTYGTPADDYVLGWLMWADRPLTVADVNDSGFSARLIARMNIGTAGSINVFIDYIAIVVYLADEVETVTTYKRDLSDSLGLSDLTTVVIAGAAVTRSIVDALGLATPTIVKPKYRVLDPTPLGLSDLVAVFSAQQGATISIVDSLGFNTLDLFDPGYRRLASESLGLSDSVLLTPTLSLVIMESIGFSEVVLDSVQYGRSATDSLGLADASNTSTIYQRQVDDSLGLSDLVSVLAIAPGVSIIRVTDAFGLTDSATQSTQYLRIVLDSLGLSDLITVAFAGPVTLQVTDSIGFSDAIQDSVLYYRFVEDALGLSDLLVFSVFYARMITDNIGFGEITEFYPPPIIAAPLGKLYTLARRKSYIVPRRRELTLSHRNPAGR